jgi:hypothetical protein
MEATTEPKPAEPPFVNTFTTKFGIDQLVWALFEGKIVHGYVRRISLSAEIKHSEDFPTGQVRVHNVTYEVQVLPRSRPANGIMVRVGDEALFTTKEELIKELEA